MARMVDVDALIKAMGVQTYMQTEWTPATAWGVPIVDAVEVVRCKDCIHCTYDDKQLLYLCDYTPFDNYVQVMPLDYCSWGGRGKNGKAD